MLTMDMTEMARMKNSYVVLFKSSRSISLAAMLTETVSCDVASFPAAAVIARKFHRTLPLEAGTARSGGGGNRTRVTFPPPKIPPMNATQPIRARSFDIFGDGVLG
jgi:hypothetical protein